MASAWLGHCVPICISLMLTFSAGAEPISKLNAQVEARITNLISRMTLEEKVRVVGGNEFETFPIERLGIPALTMTDGALGVHYDLSTAFPSGLSLGATFNPALVAKVAEAMGDEARFKGRHTLLGPCVNVNRSPFAGRNFENYGEDPYLSSRLAAAFVRGVQSQNVVATIKHLVANDQETERQTIDTYVDVRTLMEIYLPAFKAAVDAGSLGLMTAYNRVNGHYASENSFLINDVLKNMWGFQGFVVSDWDSTHSTVEAANNGLDLEMPTGKNFNSELVRAVEMGLVRETTIDDKVRRILRAIFAIGLIQGGNAKILPPAQGPQAKEHKALARRAANESLVLLKNQNSVLPLNPARMRRIALIGPNALEARTGGGGSSHVPPTEASNPADEIAARLSGNVQIVTALGARFHDNPALMPARYLKPSLFSREQGLRGEYFAKPDFSGFPVITKIDSRFDFRDAIDWKMKGAYSVRWTGYMTAPSTGEYEIALETSNHARLFIDGKEVVSRWSGNGKHLRSAPVLLKAGEWHPVVLEFYTLDDWASLYFGWQTPAGPGGLVQEAIDAASGADAAVIFAGLGNDMEGEGSDRESMAMPEGQAELIQAVARVNPKTIVVLTSGNPLQIESWLPNVPAVLQTWYPGQEGAAAIADVLLGRVNPSGKLPITYLRRWEDSPAFGNYPGVNGVLKYEEGIFVGYRHFDKNQIAPLFPFGHGLSYTKFRYSHLSVQATGTDSAKVTFDIENTGPVSGAEVAQVYVGEEAAPVSRPVRELKGFAKIYLHPGEIRQVSVNLNREGFAYFDAADMKWAVTPNGQFTFDVGSSSRDIRVSGKIRLRGDVQ